VMSLVRDARNGRDNDPSFGSRMRGTGPYAELIRARFKVASRRLELDQTRVRPLDTSLFRPECRSASARARLANGGGGSVCIAMYAGLHGIAQGLDQILEAAARLTDLPSLEFTLVGDGPVKKELMAKSRDLGLSNVRFLDALPREEMPGLVASADLAIVPLKMALPGAVPSKIYEAMGVGVPIVLVATGEAAAIVDRSQAGVHVAPGDVPGLAAAIRGLAGDPERRARLGAAGRSAAVRDFDRVGIADRFIDHLEGALS